MKKYTLVSNKIIHAMDLNVREKLVIIALIMYHNKDLGYAFPSYEELLKCTQISNKSLIKALNKLEELEYIKREAGAGGKRNKYFINEKYLIVK